MTSRERPAWFWRVRAIAHERQAQGCGWVGHLPTEPEDYDADLSECSVAYYDLPECSIEAGCTYDGIDEVCDVHGDGSDSESSRGSFDGSGSDAEYYKMNYERNQRKMEVRNERHLEKGKGSWEEEKIDREKRKQQERREDLEFESRQIQPVRDVIAAAKKRKRKTAAPLKRLGGKLFRLYSLDHVNHCPEETAPTRYIEFYSDDEYDDDKSDHPERKSKRLTGHIYLICETVCHLDYFTAPKYPSLKTHTLKADDGDWKLGIQFIDDDHLVLKLEQDLVFSKTRVSPPANAPSVFTYYGYSEDYPLLPERSDRQEKEVQRRSASPQ